jgi:hypothetical protein
LSRTRSSENDDKPPYNSDPMDQPAPEENVFAWGREMARYWENNPEPAFTWAHIQHQAVLERNARLRKFASQKNYGMVDWLLDHPVENLPDDLLAKTQGYTRNNWEVMG